MNIQVDSHRIGTKLGILGENRTVLGVVAQGQIAVRANILWVALAQKASLPVRIPDSGHAARSGSQWDIRGAHG